MWDKNVGEIVIDPVQTPQDPPFHDTSETLISLDS